MGQIVAVRSCPRCPFESERSLVDRCPSVNKSADFMLGTCIDRGR